MHKRLNNLFDYFEDVQDMRNDHNNDDFIGIKLEKHNKMRHIQNYQILYGSKSLCLPPPALRGGKPSKAVQNCHVLACTYQSEASKTNH